MPEGIAHPIPVTPFNPMTSPLIGSDPDAVSRDVRHPGEANELDSDSGEDYGKQRFKI